MIGSQTNLDGSRGRADLGDDAPKTECLADVVAWDWACGPVARHRDAVALGLLPGTTAQSLHARLFAWLQLADERNVAATWVAGQPRYSRPGLPGGPGERGAAAAGVDLAVAVAVDAAGGVAGDLDGGGAAAIGGRA